MILHLNVYRGADCAFPHDGFPGARGIDRKRGSACGLLPPFVLLLLRWLLMLLLRLLMQILSCQRCFSFASEMYPEEDILRLEDRLEAEGDLDIPEAESLVLKLNMVGQIFLKQGRSPAFPSPALSLRFDRLRNPPMSSPLGCG